MKQNILGFTYQQLQVECLKLNEKKYRAKQLYTWIYQKQMTDFFQMSDISKASQERFNQHFTFDSLTLKTCQVSKDETRKYLFETVDGAFIESVLMTHEYGLSLCVTSQIGCNMGCTFCASGILKKQRNLSAAEIVAQVLMVQQDVGKRISHIVVMGIGEPFDNFENLMDFLAIVNSDHGLAIGARHITVSTCGIAPKIREFADRQTQVNLAISLHAPTNELRRQIMPINRAYPLEELFDAIQYYLAKTNRRITYEYILLKDVNDQKEHAHLLADLVKDTLGYVNLIPYNPVGEHGFQPTEFKQRVVFYDTLMKRGVQATLRKEHGSDIDAACGQLRAKHEKKN